MRKRDRKPWIVIGVILVLMAIPSILRSTNITESEVREVEDDTHTDTDTDKEVTDLRGMPDGAIGTIEIPSLKIEYPIYEGATEAQLSIGIGHMTETAGLLETGNCVLCGHNGSSRGLYFTTLSHVKKGDEVKITRKDEAKRTYCVESMKVVDPYDRSVARRAKEEILTLFTCANHGTRRFVAVCKPKEENTGAAQTDTIHLNTTSTSQPA